ncbi:Cyclin g, partial [Operophtera brumata]
MSRAGAKHPDADESIASSSRAHAPRETAALYGTLNLTEVLNEYLLMEHKFQPKLCLPAESEHGEVTTGARDGAAHVLRCLKVWYELPAEVLIDAITLFDRFLTKMKVRSCHVPCITVSCMNIALEDYAKQNNVQRNVSIEELAERVVFNVTSCCLQESELINLLEIVACDATCVNARTSELALVLLYHKLEQQLVEWSRAPELPEHAFYLYEFASQMQQYCHYLMLSVLLQMTDASLVSVRNLVK